MNDAKHTPGPWQVRIDRCDGVTGFYPMRHTHTSIALNRHYWDGCDGHEPPMDEDGYFQPDDKADISPDKIATARLIAAAPELLEACKAVKAFGSHGETEDGICVAYLVEKAIAKAEGRSS